VAFDVGNVLHFTANTVRPLAHTVCRHKLLQLRGWRVVSLPDFVWTTMTKAEQQAHLTHVLQLKPGSEGSVISGMDLGRGSSDDSSRSSKSFQMRMPTESFKRPVSAHSEDSW
jgi:hypothetical protein